jgi:DNA-binding response OmpR family regulator
VILSATPTITSHALEAGADASVEKPFHVKELRALVKQLLKEVN